jgi:glycosyltransferase involved in cell wall biosynthesis
MVTQLYPSGLTGTSVKTRETLVYLLKKGYVIDVICIHHKKMEKRELQSKNLQIFTIERDVISKFSFPYIIRAFHLLLTVMPFRIKKMFDKRIQFLIDSLDKDKHYDVIFFDGFSTLQYATQYNKRHIYIDDEDITDLLYKRFKETNNYLLKMFFYLEFVRCKRYEKVCLSKMSQIWAISEKTADRLKNLSSAKTFIMPTIIPKQRSCYSPKAQHIVFSGLLSWLENVNGLLWFLNHHWAEIHDKFPQTTLFVTGQMASPDLILRLKETPGVVYKGFVDNLEVIYCSCALAIAPIRINSGIKVKILTYLSYGLPVVSTTTATWGLSSLDGVISSCDEEFGKSIIRLLTDSKKRFTLSKGAKNNIEKNHSWKALDMFMKRTGVFDEK